MNRFAHFDDRIVRLLVILTVIVAAFLTAGAGTASTRSSSLLDGGGFPTPTPTATLIPTLAPTNTSTTVPLDNLIPTATSIPYPFPTFDSNLVSGGESQAQASRSPSLLVLALPFLCAISLLVGIVVYWMRNARSSA